MKTLYENENIIIVSDIFDPDRVVLSFSPLMREGQTSDANSGFGYKLFNKSQISAIYFIPKWNFWYQSEYLGSALEIVLDAIQGFKEVISYGVSMGGYAALRYADYFNVMKILAFCPTVLLSKDKGAFDKRYVMHLDKLENRSDTWLEQFNHQSEAIIIYDEQHHPDNKHVDALINYGIPINKLNIAFSAHGAFGLLNECGILSEVSTTLITTNYQDNKAYLKKLIKTHRSSSSVPWMIAATYSSARGRHTSAARLYEKALSIVKHRHQNNLTIDIPNSNLLLISAFNFFIQRQQINKFIAYYEDLLKMNLPLSLLHTFAERYETFKNRPKADWVVGPSHVIRWQEHIKNNVVPSALQASHFIGIAGAPIWSKRQLELVTQKVAHASVAVLVPDFRFGNAICLASPAIEDTMADGFLAIDQRALTLDCNHNMQDRAIKALHVWHQQFGAQARYVFWCLFGRQVTDRFHGRYLTPQGYAHPSFNYNDVVSKLTALNIVDLSPLLRMPMNEVIRLFIDSSCHPSQIGYLFLNNVLLKGLNTLEAYQAAVLEVENQLISAAEKIAVKQGGKVLITGYSIWLDTLIRYMGAQGIQKLADIGVVIAPFNAFPGQCAPLKNTIKGSEDLHAYESVIVVSAKKMDLSVVLAGQTHIDQSFWQTVPCVDWEGATVPIIEARREKPVFEKFHPNLPSNQEMIQAVLTAKDVEQGAAGTPSFSGLMALLALMSSDEIKTSRALKSVI